MQDASGTTAWIESAAHIVRGHQVASGRNGDPRFPSGTVRMQTPFFKALGLDLAAYFPGTVNVSVAPRRYQLVQPRITFRAVKWHPAVPAEDFSFFDTRVVRAGHATVEGLIYFPHPQTKPEHFQQPDVLELLLPFTEGLGLGTEIRIAVRTEQMLIT
jgi:CTP-dependent riboflavin kinase